MPSKGIQCYSYNATSDCQIEFSVPGKVLTKTTPKEWTLDHLEVDKHNIPGLFDYSGVFRCRVLQNGIELMNKWVEINVLTGNLQGGNMKDMIDQTSVFINNVSISFSFYDAPDKSIAGLPIWDQFYVSVTNDNSNWMSIVAPPHSTTASLPFTKFILPAAHDVGMNSLQNTEACIQNAAFPFLAALKSAVPAFDSTKNVPDDIVTGFVPDIIQGLAITQKDTLNSILALGARYFEFRPAYLLNEVRKLEPLPDVLYFMHGPIPGMGYDKFLSGCFSFLDSHPGEIIVTQLRWDGVPKECETPSAQALQDRLNKALQPFGNIKVGSLDDMQNFSVDQLRAQQKRFILLQNVNSYSTYTDQGNATLTGDSIIAEFNALSTSGQANMAFTNIQCQATATNLTKVVIFSSLTANVSNSCLLCTKAICDNKTMPWIKQNALSKLQAEQLIVIMDDFFDGGVCDLARDLTLQRLGNSKL